MWAKGTFSCANIGRVLGLTKNMVAGKINRMRAIEGEERWRVARATNNGKHMKGRQSRSHNAPRFVPSRKERRPPQLLIAGVARSKTSNASTFHPQPIRFLDRTLDRCAFPIEGEPGPDMQCCGAKVRDIGGVYCDYHCSICFGRELAPVKIEEAA